MVVSLATVLMILIGILMFVCPILVNILLPLGGG